MRRKQSGIDSLYDIRAVRILVDDVKDCYAALGIVHHLWTPLPREFDDYIAKPKANDYRSLHTAVIGPEGKPLEVQIRTREMHQHSEYGVAAHWRYKEGGAEGHAPRSRVRGPDRVAAAGARLEGRGRRRVRVARRVQEQPLHRHDLRADAAGQGRRPAARRDAGRLRVRGAYETSATAAAARASTARWCRSTTRSRTASGSRSSRRSRAGRRATGSIRSSATRTATARATKVRQWFKAQQHEETLAQGRAIVERELARAGATAVNLDAVAAKAGFAQRRRALRGGRARRAQHAADRHGDPGRAAARRRARARDAAEVVARQSKAAGAGSGILVVGVDRLMTNLARCCKPAPPDRIVGFVTRGKGVTIHRQRCSNVARMRAREPERLITADWGKAARRGVPRRRRARGDGPPGIAARHHRDLFARADQRHRGEHADAQQRDADGVHARGEEPRRARARARAREGREGRA